MSEGIPTVNEFLAGLVDRIDESDEFEDINWRLQFIFTQDGNDKWYVIIEDGKPQGPVKGELDNPSVIFNSKFADFYAILTDQLNPIEAVMTGRFRMTGDATIAEQLKEKLL